jgi:beta-lactamase regulating signal transducer with metallopeptidase domain
MIEQINHIAQLWWSGTIAMFWQVSVLIILIGCADLIIRKWAWPQLRYALWLMVLVKLILPPTISLSTSVTSGLKPLAKQIVAQENRRENLNSATATILANFEKSVAEYPSEALSSHDIVAEQPPVVVFTGSENVVGESLSTIHIRPVWQVYAMAVWLAGMFILGGWLILKLLYLRKADRRLATTVPLPESFYIAIARCAKSLGLRRVPKVVLTRKVACPAVFGVVRPVLLMPVGYLSKMTRKDTEHMLLHELAHIKRGDLWVHGFYMLLQVVYWYNPLLWLVRSQMHHLRELCCDATVARLLRERISEYRQTLIDVARRFLTKPTEPGLGLLGLFEDSNRILVRLNWLKKETWRYQKMKKLTVITTIVLMFAFVLPMAQAQDKPSTESSSADSVQAAEQPSQTEETLETEQVENEPQTKEQLLKSKQALQTQLQQLDIEKQKIQQQLKAILQQAQYAKNNATHAKMKAKEAALKAEKEQNKAEKAKASAEAAKAEAEAKKWEHWANSWVNSKEFKQWQKEMEQWGKEYAKAHENAISSDSDHISVPKPHPMPAMPPMPPMPAHADFVAPDVVVPASTVAPVAPTVVTPKVMPHIKVESHIHDKNAVVHDDKDDKCVATKEMQFVAKVKSGIPFIIRNSLGNITLKPSNDNTCDVKAVIRAKAKTDAEAQEMVEKVSMNVESTDEKYYLKPVKPDGEKWKNINVDLYIAVPVGVRPDVKTDLGNIDLSNLKGNIKAVTNLGNMKAVDTAGNVNLHTDLGNVEFIAPKDMAGGDVKLVTNLGNIEFTAPKELSAKLQAQAKMGEIKSELPLKINKPDMFKRTTEGTIGSGQANISMTTNMGKVNLKWQSSSQDETKL